MADPLRRWLPVLVWAGCITVFSSGWFSGAHTGSALLPVLAALLPHWSSHELLSLHAAIRKGAHVFEYAVLGALLLRAIAAGRPPRWTFLATAVAAGAAFAALDELHQAFVPSRVAAPGDVLIDAFGVCLGVTLLAAVRTSRRQVAS